MERLPTGQYDYDHRYDNAIYMDKAFKERKLSVLKVAYEECRTLAKAYAGPAVLETFGEEGFTPENKKEAFALSEKQEKLSFLFERIDADCRCLCTGNGNELLRLLHSRCLK